jgi:hypothetical protein
VLTEGKKGKRMGAQKKVKKSNESINSRLALVMKSGNLVGPSTQRELKGQCFGYGYAWIRIDLAL